MSITRGNTNANAFHHHSTIDEKYSLVKTLDEDVLLDSVHPADPPDTFRAICLSGYRTEHNNTTGTDPSDAKAGIENGRQFLEITVYPRDNYFSNPIRSPLLIEMSDPDKFQRLQETIAYCSMDNMYRVRSYFDQNVISSPVSFGQVVELKHGNPEPGETGPLAGYRWNYCSEPRDVLFDTLFDINPEPNTLPSLFGGNFTALLSSMLPSDGDMFARPSTPSEKLSHSEKINSLDPRMRPKVERVIASLKSQNFRPKIYFAWRSLAEQKDILQKGNSKVQFSFHTAYKNGKPNAYAVDIIDSRWAWTDAAEQNGFWAALGKAGKAEGLYWGGDWTGFPDLAHLQYYDNNMLEQVKKESGLPDSFKIKP